MTVRFERFGAENVDQGLIAEVLDLYGVAFRSWPFRDPGVALAEHLRWKISSPLSPNGLLVGRIGSRVASVSTVKSFGVRVNGSSLLNVSHPDTTTHPDFQGHGVFAEALRHIRGDLSPPHDCNIRDAAVHPATRKNDALASGVVANRMRTWVRVLDPDRAAEEVDWGLAGWRALVWKAIARGLGRHHRQDSDDAGAAVRPVEVFCDRVEALFEHVVADFGVIVERTAEHLNWRFLDAAAGPFCVRCVEEEGRWLGYAVVRLDGLRCEIADLLTVPGRADVQRALLKAAVDAASSCEAAAITIWLPSFHPYARALRSTGFWSFPAATGVVYRIARARASGLGVLQKTDARLHFTIGDTDLV